MRRWGVALALALSVPIGGCVQTRQFADIQFTPPQGNYKLLVLRPDVTVGSLTTGGMVEPRADWTDQARDQHHRRAPGAAGDARRQSPVHRSSQRACRVSPPKSLPTSSASTSRSPSRSSSTNISAIISRPSAARASTGRWARTRCGSGRRPAMIMRLFLHAEDQVASTGRIALGVIGLAGCFVGFCAPNVGGATQLDYASLVDLKTGEVVWFNVVQAGSQVPGIKFGDLRTPQGRGADGRAAARADEAGRGGPPRAGEAS